MVPDSIKAHLQQWVQTHVGSKEDTIMLLSNILLSTLLQDSEELIDGTKALFSADYDNAQYDILIRKRTGNRICGNCMCIMGAEDARIPNAQHRDLWCENCANDSNKD